MKQRLTALINVFQNENQKKANKQNSRRLATAVLELKLVAFFQFRTYGRRCATNPQAGDFGRYVKRKI